MPSYNPPRRHHLTRHYGRENPLSEGAMVGIALGAIALTGGIAYLMLRKPATTTTTPTTSPSPDTGTNQQVALQGVPTGLGGTAGYVVQPGDTPMSIAQHFTGDAMRATELAIANRKRQVVELNKKLASVPILCAGETIQLPPWWGLPVIEYEPDSAGPAQSVPARSAQKQHQIFKAV